MNGVSFTYPTATEPAIRDVSLSIRTDEVVALVGEDGSGKTTLAKLLAGLYRPLRAPSPGMALTSIVSTPHSCAAV